MLCCPNCFNHIYLKKHIKTISGKNEKCSFCSSSQDVPVIEAVELIDLFQPLLDLYQPFSEGVKLVDLLQKDWHIFGDDITEEHRGVLLTEIMADDTLSELKVESQYDNDSLFIKSWEDFKEELQHENRFFPKKAIEVGQIQELLYLLILRKTMKPKSLYRARKNEGDKIYKIENMGKPKIDKVSAGRANPKGISYFYCASDELTAISETRPYKSEIISVGEFSLSDKATLIDLRDPQMTVSPFGLEEERLLVLYTQYIPFLSHLSKSLSIPVLPYNKDLEYLPTQYLCELIKYKDFDGIVFRSSLGAGDNYVIFDDSLLTGKKVEYYRNEDITFNPVKIKL